MKFGLLARRKNFRRGFARIRADSRESARIRADSARFRADPPDVRQKYFSADSTERPVNVRRTPADSARIRADPRGVRGELAEEFTRKMSADNNLPYTTVLRGETSAAEIIIGSGLGLGLGLWYSNPNPNHNPNPNLNHNPNLNPNSNPNPNLDPTNISAADGRPLRKFFREEQRF